MIVKAVKYILLLCALSVIVLIGSPFFMSREQRVKKQQKTWERRMKEYMQRDSPERVKKTPHI
jgi:hypothetical protein